MAKSRQKLTDEQIIAAVRRIDRRWASLEAVAFHLGYSKSYLRKRLNRLADAGRIKKLHYGMPYGGMRWHYEVVEEEE